ncbi:unnamed protein product, partial [Prorocentrum cordatum]
SAAGGKYAERSQSGEKDLGSQHVYVAAEFLDTLGRAENLPTHLKEDMGKLSMIVDVIPFNEIADLVRLMRVHITLNPLGLNPFDSHAEDENNRIRAGNTESPIKLEPLSIPQIRDMIYGATQAMGGAATV